MLPCSSMLSAAMLLHATLLWHAACCNALACCLSLACCLAPRPDVSSTSCCLALALPPMRSTGRHAPEHLTTWHAHVHIMSAAWVTCGSHAENTRIRSRSCHQLEAPGDTCLCSCGCGMRRLVRGGCVLGRGVHCLGCTAATAWGALLPLPGMHCCHCLGCTAATAWGALLPLPGSLIGPTRCA